MSTLLELQKQLRQVTEDYHAQMLSLTRELALTAQKEEKEREGMDFQRLVRSGSRRPLRHRGLRKADEALRSDYLTLLCAVVQSAPEMEEGWLLLQRIACGVGIDSLEPLAAAAMCLEMDDMERMSRQIRQNGLQDRFLLDAILLRLACPRPCPQTEALLVDLSALMECSADDLRFLSALGVVLARQDGPAYLSMGIELGERDWPGLEYIRENAGILYTDQFSEARKQGFRSVILHDCTVRPKDISDSRIRLENCVLTDCVFSDASKLILVNTVAYRCKFCFPFTYLSESLYQIRMFTRKDPQKLVLDNVAHKKCQIQVYEGSDPDISLTRYVDFINTSKQGLPVSRTLK